MDGKQCWEAACKLGIGYDMVLARENGAPIPMQHPEELTGEAREEFLNSLSPENLLEVVRLAKTSHEQIDPKKLRDVEVIAVTTGRDMMNRCDAEFKRMLKDDEIRYTDGTNKLGEREITYGSKEKKNEHGGILDHADYLRNRSRELKESIKGVIKTVEPINNDTSRKSAKELNNLRLDTLKEKIKSGEIKATKEHQDKQDTRDLIMAKRLGLTNAVVKNNDKEVQKYEGQQLNDYKNTLKPGAIARLQQKFGKQNG
jgi:LPS O-antigen subunit length determinant protein (WzzB/FepE family)